MKLHESIFNLGTRWSKFPKFLANSRDGTSSAFLRIIKCLVSREYTFTIPLILKSDWLLHLPYITFLESNVTVIRIKEMITNLKSSCLSNKFSLYFHRKCKEKIVEIRIMKLGCKRWSPSHLCSAGVPQQKTDFSIGLYLSLNFVCFGSFVFTSEAFEENKNKKNNIIYPSTSSRNVFNIGMSNRFGERIAQHCNCCEIVQLLLLGRYLSTSLLCMSILKSKPTKSHPQ